tara:strand:- start:15 stop:188 length:174 start_codon:yes stop_codon:yes gene_type:complete
MNIKSVKYVAVEGKGNVGVTATIDGEEWSVPMGDNDNRHWVAIQKWVAEGNKIAEAD